MPRGRHRQAPPLHRLLAPSAVAAGALACAGGAWLVGETGDPEVLALRFLAAGAALAAVAGAVLLRHWDREAGRRVGEVKAAKATAEWRAEERQAELETELEESVELRRGVEAALRKKSDELARLRTEHAALLRRYATAETERASALEGRRQLALEAAGPARELTTGAADHRRASGAPTPLTYLQADEALRRLRTNAARQREREEREERERREAEERERREAERAAAEERAPARGPVQEPPRGPWQGPPPPPPQGGMSREPYGQRSEGTAPRRGGFDFFGTQRRRRAPGAQRTPGEPPADQEGDRGRAAAPSEPPSQPTPGPVPEPVIRTAPRAVAGKVIDVSVPDPADAAGPEDRRKPGPTGKPRRRART